MRSRKGPFALLSCWMALSAVVLAGDFATGPYIAFPIFFVAPVSLAAWHNGRRWGIAFACVLPIVRFGVIQIMEEPWRWMESPPNTAIQVLVLVLFAYLVDRTARQTRELQKEVRVLEGLLPVCSFCKKIRNDQGVWEQMERYISDRSEAEFSHGLCPECAQQHYGEYLSGGKADGKST